jgi:peptidoglycan/LPS O-acetylase OafA/YrhL
MVRTSAGGELANIQALRALAAIAVMSAHVGSSQGPAALEVWTREGIRGVDLFFVISGFIMVYIAWQRWTGAGRFLLARALRIYPLWWVCLFAFSNVLSSLGGQLATGSPLDWYAIKSIFLIPALDADGLLYPIGLTLGWTLSYELFFYLLFAVAMSFSGPKHLTLKIAVAFAVTFAASTVLPAGAWQKFFGNSIYFEFLFGVLLGECYVRNRIAPALALLVAAQLAKHYAPASWNPIMALRCIEFGLPMAILVAAALLLDDWKVRAPKFVVWLGDGSYSIYLAHLLMLGFFINLLAPMKAPYPFTFTLLVGLGVLAACMLVYLLVERPIHMMTRIGMRRLVPAREAAG